MASDLSGGAGFQGLLDEFGPAKVAHFVNTSTETLLAPSAGRRLRIYRIIITGPDGGTGLRFSDGAP